MKGRPPPIVGGALLTCGAWGAPHGMDTEGQNTEVVVEKAYEEQTLGEEALTVVHFGQQLGGIDENCFDCVGKVWFWKCENGFCGKCWCCGCVIANVVVLNVVAAAIAAICWYAYARVYVDWCCCCCSARCWW